MHDLELVIVELVPLLRSCFLDNDLQGLPRLKADFLDRNFVSDLLAHMLDFHALQIHVLLNEEQVLQVQNSVNL